MPEGAHIRLRQLPQGAFRSAQAGAENDGRNLEVGFSEAVPQQEFPVGAPVEIEREGEILLAVVERREDRRAWLTVEHILNRATLARSQALWTDTAKKLT